MSDQESREKRSKRLHSDETKVKKRTKVIKELSIPNHILTKQPHRLHKQTGMNCGSPECFLCGNPRKIFHELTKQEQSFYQDKLWSDNESKVNQLFTDVTGNENGADADVGQQRAA